MFSHSFTCATSFVRHQHQKLPSQHCFLVFFGFESETARALYALTIGLTVVFPPGGGGPGLQVAQQNMSSVYFFNFGSYCPRSVATEKERMMEGWRRGKGRENMYVNPAVVR